MSWFFPEQWIREYSRFFSKFLFYIGPLPGILQLLVCIVLELIGFEFDDLKSWVLFLYLFHSIMAGFTGKSLSEVLIYSSINPQYDNRLSNDLPAQYMKTTSSEHGENMICTQIVFCFDIQNNFCTQHVLPMF